MKAIRHSFVNDTMQCWYGNDWAKGNTAEWMCPRWSNVFQKPKPSQMEGYAFLWFFSFFFFFIFHSGTCALLSAVLSFHVATAPVRSWRVRSTFKERPFFLCMNEFAEVLGALLKPSPTGSPCSTDLQRAQFTLPRDFVQFSCLFEIFQLLTKILLRFMHGLFYQETRV